MPQYRTVSATFRNLISIAKVADAVAIKLDAALAYLMIRALELFESDFRSFALTV